MTAYSKQSKQQQQQQQVFLLCILLKINLALFNSSSASFLIVENRMSLSQNLFGPSRMELPIYYDLIVFHVLELLEQIG